MASRLEELIDRISTLEARMAEIEARVEQHNFADEAVLNAVASAQAALRQAARTAASNNVSSPARPGPGDREAD